MSVRIQNAVRFFILFLLISGCASALSQTGMAQPRLPTRDDAINSRQNAYIRQQDRRAAEEFNQMAWENEQRLRMEAEAAAEAERQAAAIRNRQKTDRRTSPGFQSPTELNETLETLRSGDSIELHGDLFTAFDGMILSATYYRGAHGKESVPVVLLHGLGGSRSDFDKIIPTLLKEGMAVLVPDIRGHGKSNEYIVEEFGEPYFPYYPEILIQDVSANPFANAWLPNRWQLYQRMSADVGYQKPTTQVNSKRYDRYDERDFALTVFDLQVWQNFLFNENNQERLNIKKLNLVGTEMGAGLAVHWCRNDLISLKQAKTLTLISPVIPANAMEAKKGNGINLAYLNNNAMKNTMQTMIIVGKGEKRALDDAVKIRDTLLGKDKADNEPGLKAKYPLFQLDTSRQGRDLFEVTSLQVADGINVFIKDRQMKLEAAAAEKKNDKSLIWAAGNWNKKVSPPPEKPAAKTTATSAKSK